MISIIDEEESFEDNSNWGKIQLEELKISK